MCKTNPRLTSAYLSWLWLQNGLGRGVDPLSPKFSKWHISKARAFLAASKCIKSHCPRHTFSRLPTHPHTLLQASQVLRLGLELPAFARAAVVCGMEAPPLQRWLASELRTLGLDDAVFAPYIHALLTEVAEGGSGQDGNVEATLASLCPPQQEQQVR